MYNFQYSDFWALTGRQAKRCAFQSVASPLTLQPSVQKANLIYLLDFIMYYQNFSTNFHYFRVMPKVRKMLCFSFILEVLFWKYSFGSTEELKFQQKLSCSIKYSISWLNILEEVLFLMKCWKNWTKPLIQWKHSSLVENENTLYITNIIVKVLFSSVSYSLFRLFLMLMLKVRDEIC